jgi:hypothetical protein
MHRHRDRHMYMLRLRYRGLLGMMAMSATWIRGRRMWRGGERMKRWRRTAADGPPLDFAWKI